jgi:pimeloyl-ACP methyl ester carboxylesterase
VRYACWWVAAGILLVPRLPAAAPDPAEQAATDVLKIGSVTLYRCATPAPWCGRLSRPLDPAGVVPGSISIYFEFYPHTEPAPTERVATLVATEGGPGFAATDSRDEYLELLRPLRGKRDVVLMDNRGTGGSGAVDCHPLQTEPTLTEANIARCGRTLGPRAPLYSATLAADDLAAILDALGTGPVDLYGDSYGTFFEQVFAVRHPEKLRSVILDGAYPLDGEEYAWYPNYAPAMRAKFDLACERSQECSRLLGTSLEHIVPALDSLRREPVAAKARDGDGNLRSFTANATQLAMVMFGSAPAHATVRETDAAARAYVAGDRLPLFRLMAETQVSVDSRDETRSPAKFSEGLAAAVMCEDAPQVFDMSLDPSQRASARDKALADRKRSAPATYAPFTIDEYRGMPLDYAVIDQCANWPAVRVASMAKLRGSPYPDIPALIISGDLDNMTPVADGALVAKRFAHGRQIVVPNGFHVNALPHSRSACPAEIARRFIETLEVGDTQCLQAVPEVRVLPAFAQQVHELEPARALPGNEAVRAQLQIVTGAVFTVGDALARIGSNTTGKGVGLRGGTIDIASGADASRLTLHDVLWTNDLRVSGSVVSPGRSGDGTADILVAGPDGMNGALKIRWSEGVARARAKVHGTFGKAAVVAETSAP